MSTLTFAGLGSSGPGVVTGDRLHFSDISNKVRYVDSNHPNAVDDSLLTDGANEKRPFATLRYAVSQAADNDVIVLCSGHEEELSSNLVIPSVATVVGVGRADGKPTVKFTATGDYQFTLSGSGIVFANVWLAAGDDGYAPRVYCSGSGVWLDMLYVESGTMAQSVAVQLGDYGLATSCDLVSTATSLAERPGAAMIMDSDYMMYVRSCSFDDGEYGFTTAALRNTTGTQVYVESTTLLNGADICTCDNSTGYVVGVAAGEGARHYTVETPS